MNGTRIVRAMTRSHRYATWIWAAAFAAVVVHLISR